MSDEVIDLTLSSSDSDVASAGESDTDGSPLQQVPDAAIVDKLKRYVFYFPTARLTTTSLCMYDSSIAILSVNLFLVLQTLRQTQLTNILSDADEESTSSV